MGKNIKKIAEGLGSEIVRRSTNRQAAEILARVICPERAGWSDSVAQYFLRLRFADEDLDRFHSLLAGHYGDSLTVDEAEQLERYLFANCLLELFHERARRSLAKAKAEV